MSTEDTRDVRIVKVSELVPGDVLVPWGDDGFPWEGVVSYVENVPRGMFAGGVEWRYRIRYTHGQESHLVGADELRKVRNQS